MEKAKLRRPSASPKQNITSPGQHTPKKGDKSLARFRNMLVADVLSSTLDPVADQKKSTPTQKKLATTPAQKRTTTKNSPATTKKQQQKTAKKGKSDKQNAAGKMKQKAAGSSPTGNKQKATGNKCFLDVDIHIELQAFRLLFPLRTTDWNPYDQDDIAKDRFFRPTRPIHGAEWDIVVPLFHSMDYTPFDHYLIIIESLLRLLPPNHFRSIPHQR